MQLLVGIKDTNDLLVSATLRALADLVPLLGSENLIAGKRAKLFSDSSPNIVRKNAAEIGPRRNLSNTTGKQSLFERPSPDGEEHSDSQEILQNSDEDLEKWDDWVVNENNINSENYDSLKGNQVIESQASALPTMKLSSNTSHVSQKKNMLDISELDIKSQLHLKESDIDFFEDMEPIINSSNKFLVDEENNEKIMEGLPNKFALNVVDNASEGWDDNWD